MSARAAASQRGGWWKLLEHMYTNGDYPFKMGRLVGTDVGGNKYYENLVDYPFGQHRWVEYKDIHNYDASQVQPEWQGWLCGMHDVPGDDKSIAAYFEKTTKEISHPTRSDATQVYAHGLGFRNELPPLVNHMHDQTGIRERGYRMGNSVVGIPPGFGDNYYKQPGSMYAKGDGRFKRQKGVYGKDWSPAGPSSSLLELSQLDAVVASMSAAAAAAGKPTDSLTRLRSDMSETAKALREREEKEGKLDAETPYGGRVRSLWASDNSAKIAPGDPGK